MRGHNAPQAKGEGQLDDHLVYRGKAKTNSNVDLWDSRGTYLVNCDEVPWTPLREGEWGKLLNFDPASGKYTMLYKLRAGGIVPVHTHLGATEFFVLQGSFGYEAGDVGPNGYGFEYPFAVHEPIASEHEDLIMLVINYGNTQEFNDDGSPGQLNGMAGFIEACRANDAVKHLEDHLPFPPRM